MELLVFIICLLASIIGSICGIGGGVIIKPLLDSMQIMSVSQLSFLSGCTVLCMSAYSVLSSVRKDSTPTETRTVLPLAVGASIGGVIGKSVFKAISGGSAVAGVAQSSCMMVLLIGTFFYKLYEKRIRTYKVESRLLSVLIGLLLGIFSSFLGIGGGPFNMVILSFFFSQDIKTAAKHSLIMILLSQLAGLCYSLITRSAPEISLLMLIVMAVGGICGGVVGRLVNRKISAENVHRLFLIIILVIIGICIYNITCFV